MVKYYGCLAHKTAPAFSMLCGPYDNRGAAVWAENKCRVRMAGHALEEQVNLPYIVLGIEYDTHPLNTWYGVL